MTPTPLVKFEVLGDPVPQGSKRIVQPGGALHARLIDTNQKKLRPYRRAIQDLAAASLRSSLYSGPVEVVVTFCLARPQAHYRTGKFAGQVKDAAPHWPTTKPDLDKLARAVLDGLTGAAIVDDSQVASLAVDKVYVAEGTKPRTEITVWKLEQDETEGGAVG